jgi:Flp pilus assembly protein CpaB
MDGKKIILLAGALIIAIATAFMARSMFSNSGAPQATAANMQPALDGPQVLVATRALPVGTIIEPNSFRFQPWPKDLVENAYYLKDSVDPASLAGSVVRNAITAGQPVTQGALVKPGDRGFLAAALGPGMRAVTVPVSAQSSVAGFIFPGDRVDLVLTQQVVGGGDGQPLKVSETIVQNMRVLATDQRTDAIGEDGKPKVVTYSNVTLEVTPKIAEKIAVAQTVGSLSLSLRSMADSTSDLESAIASGEVNVPESDDPAAEKRMMLAVANRPTASGSSFATGADVSRFQRRTVPGKVQEGAPPVIEGPAVRIARGASVSVVPLGSK